MKKSLALVAALLLHHAPLHAQHGETTPPTPTATAAELSQFDFLLGEWTLTVAPKMNGLVAAIHGVPKLIGTWRAWRTFDGQGLEDELRIVDASGNPKSLSRSMRVYDAGAHHWVTAMLDVSRTRANESIAQFVNGEMVITSKGVDADGKPILSRSRYFEIKPTSFRYQQDRSTDDGKTWTEGTLKIEAKRTAAVAHP